MDENCTHDCSTCSANCSSRSAAPTYDKTHEMTHVKKVIGIVSGKGGVGKSLVASLMAVLAKRAGFRAGILDADITGPSIPKAFGIHSRAFGDENGLLPVASKTGIPIMSVNLLLGNETDPVIWRGPVIAGVIKQFWTDVIWGDLDVLFLDCPPGTGDVPLTVFQSIPLDGLIIVATPQELVGMIVEKAYNMAAMMNVPVLGLVENMSYVKCPDCGKEISIFGESRLEETAKRLEIEHTARIPVDPKLAAACDKGMIELFDGGWLDGLLASLKLEEDVPEKP